jgi:hypothetical protein
VPSTLTDVCSFPIHVHAQDTISANGKTLVGDPYTFNIEILYDSNLNIMGFYLNGIAEKIPLPDGSLFISAGRMNLLCYLLSTCHPTMETRATSPGCVRRSLHEMNSQ